ncbi:MAG TPA: hypothetical protein VNV37_08085 [Solirubrobacteraceae bacterium]|nr:hypothetical protein [Solirubrobacteraceae bacterium]
MGTGRQQIARVLPATPPAGEVPHEASGDGGGPARLLGGGPEGNERLTVLTGVLLLVLLAALGVTIVRVHALLWEHLFIGLLLIGPVALKLCSTGYRFIRYYTRAPVYRRKGPPPAPLRALGPLVVLSTLVVFASGVALLLVGPSARPTLYPIHKYSFFVWLAATGLHVLGHLSEVLPVLSGWRVVELPDRSGASVALIGHRFGQPTADAHAGWRPLPAGRSGRAFALASAIVLGVALALVLIPQYAPWLHYHHVFVRR